MSGIELEPEQVQGAMVEALAQGTLTLEALFAIVAEEKEPKHVGSMGLRDVLLACPHIGPKHAERIVTELKLKTARDLSAVDAKKQAELIERVAAVQGSGGLLGL